MMKMHSLLLAAAAIVSACASTDAHSIGSGQSSNDDVAATDSDPVQTYRLELTGSENDVMCNALDAAIQKNWNPNNWGLCSIPIDEAGPGFTQPEWHDVNGEELLPEIRELALLKAWRGPLKPITAQWKRVSTPSKAPEELVEQVWNPMEEDFIALLRSGELKVQEAEFDFNNDGEIDTIYRIRGWTLVETGRTDKPFEPEFWDRGICPLSNIDMNFIMFKKRTRDYGRHDLAELLTSYAARSKSRGYYVFHYQEQTFHHWFYSTAITKIPGLHDFCDWRRITE